jgi:predicted MFS family arabinose efflux permease
MLSVTIPFHNEHLSGTATYGGYVFAVLETGAIITALLWGRWHARWRPEHVVLASLVGFGLVILTWPLAGKFGLLLALAALAGLASGAGMPALFTTRQRYTPPALYSQISTTGASLKLGSFALGSALGGQVVTELGTGPLMAIVALLQLSAAAAGVVTGRTRRRRIGPRDAVSAARWET